MGIISSVTFRGSYKWLAPSELPLGRGVNRVTNGVPKIGLLVDGSKPEILTTYSFLKRSQHVSTKISTKIQNFSLFSDLKTYNFLPFLPTKQTREHSIEEKKNKKIRDAILEEPDRNFCSHKVEP